jgi:competence protein ComEA
VAELSRPSSPSSTEEHAFWEREIHDEPEPRRRARPHPLPRREQRLARVADGPLARLIDRLHDWRADARFGVVLLVLIAVVAGVVWYRIGVGGASAGESAAPRAVTTTVSTTMLDDSTRSTGPKGTPARLVVHVAGAVTHPGVVELNSGARVIDAVEAVGGASADGDLDRLNLAAKVTDGERVYVAKVGQADPGVIDGGGADAPGPSDGGGTGGGVGAKVNLNTATQAQLEELPGIGPTYAQSIIAERQRRGGFTSVNDLRSVRGIGDKRFAELAPLVTV